MGHGTRCILGGSPGQQFQALSASYVTFNGLVNACGEAAWDEGKARLVCANGITKSLPCEASNANLVFYGNVFALLLSFEIYLFILFYFFWRMPYVEHDRLAEESRASRSVLKDIRVLILM